MLACDLHPALAPYPGHQPRLWAEGRSAPYQTKNRGLPGTPTEDQVKRALGLTYRCVLPRLQRDLGAARLGIARPSYAKACVRNHEFMVGVSEELGEWYERVIRECEKAAQGKSDEWRRIERRHLDDAAITLVEAVELLLPPIRKVIIMRSAGARWRDVWSASGQGRPYFSLKDDWRQGLIRLATDARDAVRRLT